MLQILEKNEKWDTVAAVDILTLTSKLLYIYYTIL